jgi:DNA-binding transcriptional LysR family regulator
MDLDCTPYRYFVAVAEARNFSRAAERLNVSQPALSAQIKEFERRLGFALFDRSTRRVELTSQGRLFLPNARRMIVEAAWAIRAANEIRTNELRIGCPIYTAFIPERLELVERFILSRPKQRLSVSHANNAKLYGALRDRELDIVVTIEPEADREDGSAIESAEAGGFERVVLGRRRLRLLAPAAHPWADLACVPAAALRGQRILGLDRSHGVALTELIARKMIAAGAELVRAPEANPIAMYRHARLLQIPSLSLGWYDMPASACAGGAMLDRPTEIAVWTSLVAIRNADADHRPGAEAFWRFASERARPVRTALRDQKS